MWKLCALFLNSPFTFCTKDTIKSVDSRIGFIFGGQFELRQSKKAEAARVTEASRSGRERLRGRAKEGFAPTHGGERIWH